MICAKWTILLSLGSHCHLMFILKFWFLPCSIVVQRIPFMVTNCGFRIKEYSVLGIWQSFAPKIVMTLFVLNFLSKFRSLWSLFWISGVRFLEYSWGSHFHAQRVFASFFLWWRCCECMRWDDTYTHVWLKHFIPYRTKQMDPRESHRETRRQLFKPNKDDSIPIKNTNVIPTNIDHIPSNTKKSDSGAMLCVFEDNEAVIKMIIKGRSPTMRHVSRSHRVALDWLFDRIYLDPKIKSITLTPNTKSQTCWLKKISHMMSGTNLLHLFKISNFSSSCCTKNSMQCSLNKDHQHLKWHPQKLWTFFQGFQDVQGQAADAVSAYTQVNKKDAPTFLKLPKSECPDIWIRPPKHKWPMVQYGRPSRSPRKESGRSSCGRTIMGKTIRKSSTWKRLGTNFKLGMFIRSKLFLSVCVDDIKLARKTERWSGRTNIISWPCIFRLHSTSMRSKPKYCGQLQNHVWIANFCGGIGKITILSEQSYLFMVVWHGGSCKEICGKMLRICK